MNKVSYFLITLFFGMFGVHKFINKKYGFGLLYFCTVGLFGIGWLYDSIKAFVNIFTSSKRNQNNNIIFHPNQNHQLYQATKMDMLQLQNLVLPGQSKLIMSLSDLKRHSENIISRYSDIVDDCKYLISTTDNPETFFPRYKLMLDTLYSLKAFEPFFYFEGYMPSQQLDYDISIKQIRIQDLTKRLYNKTLIKADSLKTVRGRQNQFIRAFDSLMNYKNEMTNDTIIYIKEIFGTKIETENNAENDTEFHSIDIEPVFTFSYEPQQKDYFDSE